MSFAQVPRKLIDDTSLPALARFLYVILLDHAGQDDVCWPTVASLATKMDLTENTVRKLIHLLVNHHYIVVEQRKDGGAHNHHQYRLLCKPAIRESLQTEPRDVEEGYGNTQIVRVSNPQDVRIQETEHANNAELNPQNLSISTSKPANNASVNTQNLSPNNIQRTTREDVSSAAAAAHTRETEDVEVVAVCQAFNWATTPYHLQQMAAVVHDPSVSCVVNVVQEAINCSTHYRNISEPVRSPPKLFNAWLQEEARRIRDTATLPPAATPEVSFRELERQRLQRGLEHPDMKRHLAKNEEYLRQIRAEEEEKSNGHVPPSERSAEHSPTSPERPAPRRPGDASGTVRREPSP